MKILTELVNESAAKIYIENMTINNKDVMIHLYQNKDHISGYFLFRVAHDGLSRINDVGETDTSRFSIKSIETESNRRLRIIGVDII